MNNILRKYTYTTPAVLVPSQVLDKIKTASAKTIPKPFAIHEQYIPEVKARKLAAESGDGGELDAEGNEPAMPKPSKKNVPRKNAPKNSVEGDGDEKRAGEWEYGKIRKSWVRAKMIEGFTHKEALNLWDESKEKATLLAPVSLGEFKRRKFLPKGSDSNPWQKKLRGFEESS